MRTFRSHRSFVKVLSYIAVLTLAVVSASPAQAAASAPIPWIHQSELSAAGGGRLGFGVAISADGQTAAVGAVNMTVNGQEAAGAIEVYRWSTGGWGDPTELNLGSNATANAGLGGALAVSAHGNTLIAAGGSRTVDGIEHPGAAQVFRFSGGKWSAPTQIDLAPKVDPSNGFIGAVALSADGKTALLGQSTWTVRGKLRAGRALVYQYVAGLWQLQAQLTLGAKARKNDDLGWSVALSADGKTALAGVPQRAKYVAYSGKAAVFRFLGEKWGPPVQLSLGAAAGRHDNFGWSVDLSSNGNVALIGVPGRDTAQPNSGAGEVFRFRAGKWGSPTQLGWGRSLDSLGQSVALSADGRTALLGSPSRKVYDQRGAGAGQVFYFSSGRWSSPGRLDLGVDASPTDVLGYSVGLSGNGKTSILGAPLRTADGAAEIFGSLGSNQVLATVNASGPRSAEPDLTSLSAHDPAIKYQPAGEARYVKGKLTCSTTAAASSPVSGNPYRISACHGLADPGHTIVYDYDHSTYIVK